MKFYNLKIREKFLDPIRNGVKRHEYRLATPERKQIKIGDVLILHNNKNEFDYVKVVVKVVEWFEAWESALNKYWESDFADNYTSLEETLKECYKFYSYDQVKKYGIEVFEIEPSKVELRGSNVLLDTNIVIHRESSNAISYDVIQLYKTLDKLKANKHVLEDIKDEIKKYKDRNVVETMLAKINSYSTLSALLIEDERFSSVVKQYSQDENSVVDNKHLYLVYKNKVDFLITDDKGILAKAKELYIDDVVLSTIDFLNKVEKNYPTFISYNVLSVDLCKMSSIDVNDQFFDTLRDDYEGVKFNNWFNKKAKDGESAYIFKNNNLLSGFLYLKIENQDENYEDITPILLPKRRLKIGTFKIKSTGLRVGERFLKIIFDYALRSEIEEIYVTLFENKRAEVKNLMKLMMDWGFEKWGYKKSNGELVLVKKMGVYNRDKDSKFNYPNLKANKKYGFLPIESCYHTTLFPDLYLKNESMTISKEKACAYAVEKIYVCSTKFIPFKEGDLLFIYRMGEGYYKKYRSVVSGICVLKQIIRTNNFEEFKKECKNRTVFNDEELEDFYINKGYRTVIKVLFLKPLIKKITLNDLYANYILNEGEGARLTTVIDDEACKKLLKMGGVEL